MDQFQFYPTPKTLAIRAWSLFQNKTFARVLEPSAGDGALAGAGTSRFSYRSQPSIDCIEIDITKHSVLRDAGFNVVGVDFMQFEGGAIYSHIILNPPFYYGAQHVLKAWECLWDGEIVAILNAETILNPFSKERQMLVNLISQYGSVEFIKDAFLGEGVVRQTNVEVALVYLRKQANLNLDVFGHIDSLTRDHVNGVELAEQFEQMKELALPNSFVENVVTAFDASVKATKEAIFAQAKANYYEGLLGKTMAQLQAGSSDVRDSTTIKWVQSELAVRYEALKDRAWASVLRSSNVTSKLSSKAQNRLESDFDKIKQLQFTCTNVYGFLCGLVENQGKIQIEMACDVFHLITSYHSDNTVYYKGWKSNDKHRTCGMKIKTSRFVIPGHRADSWQSTPSWKTCQMLRDFDKVFAMLDGRVTPEVSLENVFKSGYASLKNGERMSSSYFDIRFYPGVGTIHFFARDKKLMERFNLIVGRHHQWLPPEDARVGKAFWLHYEKAEAMDKTVRQKVVATHKGIVRNVFAGVHPSARGWDTETVVESQDVLCSALEDALLSKGIDIRQLQIQQETHEQLSLLVA